MFLAFPNFSRDQTSEMASLCLSGHGQLELGELGKRIEFGKEVKWAGSKH